MRRRRPSISPSRDVGLRQHAERLDLLEQDRDRLFELEGVRHRSSMIGVRLPRVCASEHHRPRPQIRSTAGDAARRTAAPARCGSSAAPAAGAADSRRTRSSNCTRLSPRWRSEHVGDSARNVSWPCGGACIETHTSRDEASRSPTSSGLISVAQHLARSSSTSTLAAHEHHAVVLDQRARTCLKAPGRPRPRRCRLVLEHEDRHAVALAWS